MLKNRLIHLFFRFSSLLRRQHLKRLRLRETPHQPGDQTPRLLLLSAFSAEWNALVSQAQVEQRMTLLGRSFYTGTLHGCQVAITLSGASMVNAALVTQAALDRFNIQAVIISGIGGAANPALHIGDVCVPSRWAQYQENVFASQTQHGFCAGWFPTDFGSYGMMFPQPLTVTRKEGASSNVEHKFWFEVDSGLLETARHLSSQVRLEERWLAFLRLPQAPRLVCGGNGVSGPSFVNNAAYRRWVWHTFQADVMDMESAAAAHVAYINHVPFIAIRTVSDLAGGASNRRNEILLFAHLAARNSAAVVSAFVKSWKEKLA